MLTKVTLPGASIEFSPGRTRTAAVYASLSDSPADMRAFRSPDYCHGTNVRVWAKRGGSRFRDIDGDWAGVASPAAAEAMLTDPWPEGARRAEELVADLDLAVPEAKRLQRRVRFRDQGDEIDTTRYLSGAYDTMWRSMPRDTEAAGQKIISIDVARSSGSQVAPEDLFWGGAAAAAVVDRLEDAGFRVEVHVSAGSKADGGDYALVRTKVKDADHPLSLDTLAMLCAHPATYRYWMILGYTVVPRLGYGSGMPTQSGGLLKALADAGLIDAPDVTLEPVFNRKDAIRQVEATMLKVEEIAEREIAL